MSITDKEMKNILVTYKFGLYQHRIILFIYSKVSAPKMIPREQTQGGFVYNNYPEVAHRMDNQVTIRF